MTVGSKVIDARIRAGRSTRRDTEAQKTPESHPLSIRRCRRLPDRLFTISATACGSPKLKPKRALLRFRKRTERWQVGFEIEFSGIDSPYLLPGALASSTGTPKGTILLCTLPACCLIICRLS